MAIPLGFKNFVSGDVLTAGDANGYLMQGIWTFADAAARDAAVTSPQEGNACYLKDLDVIQVYNGSSWATQSASNPISANIVDAKGDIIAATAADTVDRLAVGTNGQVLTADSTAATGLAYTTIATGVTLISTTALTGASVTTASIAATFKHLYLVIADVQLTTTLGGLSMRFNSDTGSNYVYSFMRNIGTTMAGSNNAGTSIQVCSRNASTNTANKKTQVQISLPRYTDTTAKGVHIQAYMHDDTNPGNQTTDAVYVGGSAISTITLFGDTNFQGGNFYVYGAN